MDSKHKVIIELTLQSILKTLKNNNHNDVSTHSTRLVFYSASIEYKFGIFIGEVLEGIFIQFSRDMSKSLMEEEDMKKEFESMMDGVQKIIDTLNNETKLDVYESLVDLRAITTQFQIEAPAKYPQSRG